MINGYHFRLATAGPGGPRPRLHLAGLDGCSRIRMGHLDLVTSDLMGQNQICVLNVFQVRAKANLDVDLGQES